MNFNTAEVASINNAFASFDDRLIKLLNIRVPYSLDTNEKNQKIND